MAIRGWHALEGAWYGADTAATSEMLMDKGLQPILFPAAETRLIPYDFA